MCLQTALSEKARPGARRNQFRKLSTTFKHKLKSSNSYNNQSTHLTLLPDRTTVLRTTVIAHDVGDEVDSPSQAQVG